MQLINTNNPAALADAIGTARAAVDQARTNLSNLEALAKQAGYEDLDGQLFRVRISYDLSRNTVAWEKIATDLGASKQRIVANTTTSYYDRITVTAKEK